MANRNNHAAQVAQKKQIRLDAGLVSEHFPEISHITVYMEYYRQSRPPLLMARTVNFSPEGYAYFNMGCMTRGCTDGGFDLGRIIREMVRGRKTKANGTLACKGKSKELKPGHMNIDYEISIAFRRKS
jgi:hypothetical protein